MCISTGNMTMSQATKYAGYVIMGNVVTTAEMRNCTASSTEDVEMQLHDSTVDWSRHNQAMQSTSIDSLVVSCLHKKLQTISQHIPMTGKASYERNEQKTTKTEC